jgi:hypothetical protein
VKVYVDHYTRETGHHDTYDNLSIETKSHVGTDTSCGEFRIVFYDIETVDLAAIAKICSDEVKRRHNIDGANIAVSEITP